MPSTPNEGLVLGTTVHRIGECSSAGFLPDKLCHALWVHSPLSTLTQMYQPASFLRKSKTGHMFTMYTGYTSLYNLPNNSHSSLFTLWCKMSAVNRLSVFS